MQLIGIILYVHLNTIVWYEHDDDELYLFRLKQQVEVRHKMRQLPLMIML